MVDIYNYIWFNLSSIHYLHFKYLYKFIFFHQTLSPASAGLLMYVSPVYITVSDTLQLLKKC